jgi:hypothetical protein
MDAGSAGALPALCCRRLTSHDVYLDVRRNRYFCVATGGETQRSGRQMTAGVSVMQPEMFITPARDLGLRKWCDERPRAHLDWVRFSASMLQVSLALRFSSLWTLLSHVHARRMNAQARVNRQDPTNLDDLRGHMMMFQTLRPWYPRDYRCLFDSVAAAAYLAHHGWFPALVFGVQADPFEAHCWLQEGDAVVNDALDRLEFYTPILMV